MEYKNLFWKYSFDYFEFVNSNSTRILKKITGRNTVINNESISNQKLRKLNLLDYGFQKPKITRYKISEKLTDGNKVIFLIMAPNGKYNDSSWVKCHTNVGIVEKIKDRLKIKNHCKFKI